MIIKRLVAIILLSIVFSSCAGTLPPPQPLDHRIAGIAIHITEASPVGLWFKSTPGRIYFIRLEDGASDSYIKHSVIASNYSKDGYIYLLNVPPGRYAAVASYTFVPSSKQSASYTTYYSSEVIKITEIEVKSGEIAFMGRFLLKRAMTNSLAATLVPVEGLQGAEDVQLHYFRLISPGAENRDLLTGLIFPPGDFHYMGGLLESHQSDEDRVEFVEKAKGHFKDSGWYDLLH